MLLVKISAADLRIIEGARSPEEVTGALSLVKERIQQAQVLKSFGKAPTAEEKQQAKCIRWDVAFKICQEVLGDRIEMPPYPDQSWFMGISTTLRRYRMDEARIREIAEYARDKIYGSKISFRWLITQHQRILNGDFDRREYVRGKGVKEPSGMELMKGCPLPEIE